MLIIINNSLCLPVPPCFFRHDATDLIGFGGEFGGGSV